MRCKMRFHGALAVGYIIDQFIWQLVECSQVMFEELPHMQVLARYGTGIISHFHQKLLDDLVTLLGRKVVKVDGFHGVELCFS